MYHRFSVGSPPRVREERISLRLWVRALRITPACAGRTFSPGIHSVRYQDHPRVCGKNRISSLILAREPGSPPRVREELSCILSFILLSRITPACAGRTNCSCVNNSCIRDHPRVCGKNTREINTFIFLVGSPPRVREEPLFEEYRRVRARITPACAGRT